MKKLALWCGLAALAGAAFCVGEAEAVKYLDERFDGPFPPPGWSAQGGTLSGWELHANGPWGNYAFGWAGVRGTTGSTAVLDSKAVNVPRGRRLDYSFRALANCTMSVNVRWEFWLLYAGTEEPLEHLEWRGPFYPVEWRAIGGHVIVSKSLPVFARFSVTAWGNTIQGHGEYWVDTVQLADEDLSAASPASLGRLKALFK